MLFVLFLTEIMRPHFLQTILGLLLPFSLRIMSDVGLPQFGQFPSFAWRLFAGPVRSSKNLKPDSPLEWLMGLRVFLGETWPDP